MSSREQDEPHPELPGSHADAASPSSGAAGAARSMVLVLDAAGVCGSLVAAEVLSASFRGAGWLGAVAIRRAGFDAEDAAPPCPVAVARVSDGGGEAHSGVRATAELLASAGLVLTLDREQRTRAVQLEPPTILRAFTLKEAVRVARAAVEHGDPGGLPLHDLAALTQALHRAERFVPSVASAPARREDLIAARIRAAAGPVDRLSIVDAHDDRQRHELAIAETAAVAAELASLLLRMVGPSVLRTDDAAEEVADRQVIAAPSAVPADPAAAAAGDEDEPPDLAHGDPAAPVVEARSEIASAAEREGASTGPEAAAAATEDAPAVTGGAPAVTEAVPAAATAHAAGEGAGAGAAAEGAPTATRDHPAVQERAKPAASRTTRPSPVVPSEQGSADPVPRSSDAVPTRTLLVVGATAVCRSPVARQVLVNAFRDEGWLSDVVILTAGIRFEPEAQLCPVAGTRLQRLGEAADVPRSRRRPLELTPALVADAALVLTMNPSQRSAVIRLRPGSQMRAFTLKEAEGLAAAALRLDRVEPPRDLGELARTLHSLRGTVDLSGPPHGRSRARLGRQDGDERFDSLSVPSGHEPDERYHGRALDEAEASAAGLAHGIVGLAQGLWEPSSPLPAPARPRSGLGRFGELAPRRPPRR